jgi:hypothetical protein
MGGWSYSGQVILDIARYGVETQVSQTPQRAVLQGDVNNSASYTLWVWDSRCRTIIVHVESPTTPHPTPTVEPNCGSVPSNKQLAKIKSYYEESQHARLAVEVDIKASLLGIGIIAGKHR